jgi:hypothetical protein
MTVATRDEASAAIDTLAAICDRLPLSGRQEFERFRGPLGALRAVVATVDLRDPDPPPQTEGKDEMTDETLPDLAACLTVHLDDYPFERRLTENAVRWLSNGGLYHEFTPGAAEMLEAAFVRAVAHFGDASWYDPSMHWPEVEAKVREILADFVANDEPLEGATDAS